MAKTNFGTLLSEQKAVWVRDVWKHARENSFIMQMAGSGANSMIQRITELTKTERGDRAIITLVPDLVEDGVTGDNDLEGNEEAMKAYDFELGIDQLRHAVRSEGKLAEQKTIVKFREQAKDALGFWLADRIDQMGFLTLSGIAYTRQTNGALRRVNPAGRNLSDLAFAADVSAPTSARHFRATAGGVLRAGNTAADDMVTLGYDHIMNLKAYAKEQFIRGIRGPGGAEIFHLFVTPTGMAQLKQDEKFVAAVQYAHVRGGDNPLFTGRIPMLDGVVIHEYRHIYTTRGAAAGQKWGSAGNTNGQRALFCGAQALGLIDLGGEWNEESFDYGNQGGISFGKMFGMRKTKFQNAQAGTVQDFGVIALDTKI